ncbi:MAG TPA: bacteriophage Gp15 family protein [Candidatus Blautia faecipullorum]|nr:bacteriophage Gp15 family protein [Candidatus Blautia faecipullorum]
MNSWDLPESLPVGDRKYKIRSDFRAVLDILGYFNNPDYEEDEKWWICLDILFVDFQEMPRRLWMEAAEQAVLFIDLGTEEEKGPKPRLMDWEQDAPIIIPSINRVLGKEIRALPYLHWWTFMGAYMEIGESLFSQVVSLRKKRIQKKKLEKWEKEFYRENKAICDLKKKYSEAEREEQERLKAMLD